MSARLIVRRDAVLQNYETVRKKAGDAAVWCVLKGNAYGCGLLPMAETLASAGADRFAVTEPEEAAALRAAGIAGKILLLRSTVLPEELSAALAAEAILTVGSADCAAALERICAGENRTAEIHLEFDLGMGRGGFRPERARDAAEALRGCPHLRAVGLYGHLNRAFAEEKWSRNGIARLTAARDALQAAGFRELECHAADSVALFRFPFARLDAVRVGSALVGGLLVGDRTGLVRPASAECPVTALRELLPGDTAGYGFGFTAKKPCTVAVVPMGYADGALVRRARDTRRGKDALVALRALLRRERRYTVEIAGHTCPVVGYVGMKHLLADVTGLPVLPGELCSVPVDPVLAGQILPIQWK